MATYFKVEINDVKNSHTGEKTTVDLTNFTDKDGIIAELASQLGCQLDFQDAWMPKRIFFWIC